MSKTMSKARQAVSLEKQTRVKSAIIKLWGSEKPFTWANIAELTRTPEKPPVSKSTVGNCLATFQGEGTALPQAPASGGGPCSYTFNWTGEKLSIALARTLVDILGLVYSEGSEFPLKSRAALNSALRAYFALPEQAPMEVIMARAAEVPAGDLHDLPSAAASKVLGRLRLNGEKQQSKLAANYKSVLRAALRVGARAGVVAVIFPTIFVEDAWEQYMEFMFNKRDEKFTRTQRSARCHWRALAELARKHLPSATPASLTEQELKQLLGIARQNGKGYIKSYTTWLFRRLGKERGEGPFAALMRNKDLKWSRNGHLNAGYLIGAGGDAVTDGNVERFVDLLTANGFGKPWGEFIRWYHNYSTLSFNDIEQRNDEFPPRPEKRHLAYSTWTHRLLSIRAWLHQALLITGREAGELTPEEAFGHSFREILGATKAWWAERAQRGEVSAETSDGLAGIIKAAGMIARALYDRSQHLRQRSLPRSRPVIATSNEEEEIRAKTGTEEKLWEAYMLVRINLDRIEKLRPNTPGGHRFTTEKDIRRIVENTPYTYWISLLDEMFRQIKELDARGRGNSYSAHDLVRDAYLHGILVSTAMRRSELCHIRLDVQYGPQDRAARRISLRAVDRKNQKGHRVALRERYVPDWLEERYLGQTRPFFMCQRHLLMGNLTRVQTHQHLLVDNSGRAFGDPNEAPDGTQRNAQFLEMRKATLGLHWKGRAEITAAGLNMYIPENEGEGSIHAVRNAMAAAVARAMGFEAAANLLGDSPGTVMDTYGFLDGAAIDSTTLPGVTKDFSDLQKVGVQVSPALVGISIAPVGTAGPSPVRAALDAQLSTLTEALAEGRISPGDFRLRASRLQEAMAA